MAVAVFEVPQRGLDEDSNPRRMRPRFAPLLNNFVVDVPGALRKRGPICEGTTWNLGASIGLFGAWHFDDKLLISRYAPSATATRDPWVAHYRPASAVGTLRGGDLTMKHIDLSTGAVTNVVASDADGVIGPKYVRVGNSVYGIGGDATSTSAGAPGTVFKLTQLLRWDGGTVEPVQYGVAAPVGLLDITYHYNRLFAIGEISSNANRLYWTDPLPSDGTTLPVNITAWQDDVTGLTNIIVVGSADGSDFNVALAHVGPNLCILKRRSLWMLYGTSPSNFVVKQITNDVGCIDPRSVVEYDGGVFFMSERGFMHYDGNSLSCVSQDRLQTTLVANAHYAVGPLGLDGGFCRAWSMGHGYIAVQTGITAGATLLSEPVVGTGCYLYHVPTDSWVKVSSSVLGGIVAGGRSMNHTWLMSDSKLIKANYLVDPDNAPAGASGRDVLSTTAGIPAAWRSRVQTIASPLKQSQLQRGVLDYKFTDGTVGNGWALAVSGRGSESSFQATFGAPTQNGEILDAVARGSVDVLRETDEAFVEVAAVYAGGTALGDRDSQVHAAYVEYVETRRSSASTP